MIRQNATIMHHVLRRRSADERACAESIRRAAQSGRGVRWRRRASPTREDSDEDSDQA